MTDKEEVENKPEKEPIDDDALEKLAVEELMREAVQGAARAELVGPSGWIKSQPQRANKRFLVNTLRHAVNSNRYHAPRSKHRQIDRSPVRERSYPPKEATIRKERSSKNR